MQLYFDIPICLFLTRGAKTGKTFTLKLIIQILLQLNNKNISFDLTKTKALVMASTSKTAFNIDSLTIQGVCTLRWLIFNGCSTP